MDSHELALRKVVAQVERMFKSGQRQHAQAQTDHARMAQTEFAPYQRTIADWHAGRVSGIEDVREELTLILKDTGIAKPFAIGYSKRL